MPGGTGESAYSNPLAQKSARQLHETQHSQREIKTMRDLEPMEPESAFQKFLLKLTCGVNLLQRAARGHVSQVSARPSPSGSRTPPR